MYMYIYVYYEIYACTTCQKHSLKRICYTRSGTVLSGYSFSSRENECGDLMLTMKLLDLKLLIKYALLSTTRG